MQIVVAGSGRNQSREEIFQLLKPKITTEKKEYSTDLNHLKFFETNSFEEKKSFEMKSHSLESSEMKELELKFDLETDIDD